VTEVEPNKVKAIRVVLAHRLGLDSGEIEIIERHVPGEPQDEPSYVTVLIPRNEALDDASIESALAGVQEEMWSHPAYPTQLRWEYKT
jgi:hypothetical protein